ncbi:chaperonin GroEL [Candidatus Poribacteria bacterium]|nr:chaperonin GroEL [Candidatus Poribacteria bacterium]
MAKQIAFDVEARAGIKKGAETLSRAVCTTLGPRGRNVVLQKSYGAPTVTKDGVTVAKEIELPGKYENIGAQLLRAAASKTNDDAGDGTTSAVTMAYAILQEGIKNVTAGADPMSLKRGIDKACEAVVASLKGQSRPVNGREDYERIATVASNHDATIGGYIADALEKVGTEGVITVEEGKTAETTLEVVEGMQFDKGFISRYFVNTEDGNECVLDNPYLLINQSKLSALNDLLPVLEKIAQVGRPLLIIAEDVEGEALSTLVVNRLRGNLRVCAVKAPGFGDRRKEMLRDLATLTGGQLIAEELGIRLENVVLGMLGQAERVVIDKDNTTVIRGKGKSEDIEGRKQQIRKQIEETTSDYDREKLQERLAKLAGGVAVVNVGAATEVEMKERKARVEDALSATRAAVEEGVVVGGGVSLIRARGAVSSLIETTAGDARMSDRQREDLLTGMRIIERSLEAPLRQLARNAGDEPSIVVATVAGGSGGFGYNAARRRYEDLPAAGILDPTKVVRVALQNAVSVAGLVLTTEATIAELPEKKADGAASHGHAHHHH